MRKKAVQCPNCANQLQLQDFLGVFLTTGYKATCRQCYEGIYISLRLRIMATCIWVMITLATTVASYLGAKEAFKSETIAGLASIPGLLVGAALGLWAYAKYLFNSKSK